MAHILVIDDEKPLGDVLKQVLERAGHTAVAVTGGADALTAYRQYPPDVVLTDIVMPDKNGISVIMDIRAEYPNAKIIAMSGGDRVAPEDYLTLARSLGARRTLSKPFEMSEIVETIQEVLEEDAPAS